MDDVRFDILSRSLSTDQSRRTIARLLGGLALGGPLALLRLAEAEAKCKKKCGPCKRCKKGKCKPKPAGTACSGGTCQRGACIADAPEPCVPQDPATVCAAGCGTRSDNCGRAVVCLCPDGDLCLGNGSCAQICVTGADCPAGCGCSPTNVEGTRLCADSGLTCDDVQECPTPSTASCPPGQHCQLTNCGSGGAIVNRCVPLCAG
jgi:hypothetical protein